MAVDQKGFFYAIYSLNNLTFRPIPFFPFASFPFHSLIIRKTSFTYFSDSTQILTLQSKIFRYLCLGSIKNRTYGKRKSV